MKIWESWKSPPPKRVTATMTRERTFMVGDTCVNLSIFQVIIGTHQLCHFAGDGGVALCNVGGHIVRELFDARKKLIRQGHR